jgi:hypothetical protein
MTDRIEAAIRQGERARVVLENSTVTEAMDHISAQLQKQWRATTSAMTQRREELFHQVAALDAIRAQLRSWQEAGEFEQAKLNKQNERKDRLRIVR